MSDTLLRVQTTLFTIGASLATGSAKEKVKKPDLTENDIALLENEIDRYDEVLPPLKYFVLREAIHRYPCAILPGVYVVVAERLVTRILENEPVEELVVMYLNRLSDYLLFAPAKQHLI